MKSHFKTLSLAMLIITMAATATGWSLLSSTATRLASQYERELNDLENKLVNALPKPDGRKKDAYLKAREAEAAALAKLAKAQKFHAQYGSARGLVGHAKNDWIRGAEKGLAKAKQQLDAADSAAARKAAKEEIAKWEKNKEAGLAALVERQAALDKLESDKPKADRELKEAKESLAKAEEHTLQAMKDLGLETLLTNDQFDGDLAKYVVLKKGTPRAFASYAQNGRAEEEFVRSVLADEALLIQIAVADGANNGQYERAMEIYHSIQKESPKAAEGPLQRLALAIALEHAEPIGQRNAVADSDASATVDPLKRYLQYERAYLDKQLDPAFAKLDVWNLRMVVDGEEPEEILVWGRDMLRNYRPDHVTTGDYRWRYVALVRSDIPYGSQDNKYDKDELHFFQNILMNGGVCGRRAFIGRFVLRAFGIPTTARPSKGHAALAHWTPNGWVVCLGGGWGAGWTKTAYKDDLDFLATTQARATGPHYLRVKRAHWIGDLLGEKRCYGLAEKREPEFWNGVALYTQRALIEAADAKTLKAVGEDIAEASDTRETVEIAEVEITEEDRKIHVDGDGVITIPAAATSDPSGNNRKIMFMPSTLGGKQLHYSRGAGSAEFEYSFKAKETGKYALYARLVTPSWRQNLVAKLNNNDEPIVIPLPHTVGLWDTTEPVAVELDRGRNKIRFHRTTDGSPKGFSIKEFKLVPWKLHLAGGPMSEEESAADKEGGLSESTRQRLSTSLLRALTLISADGKLQPLPMDLTITSKKVQLLEVSGSGILGFREYQGDKAVQVALEDLALKDHALLARLVARILPDDPVALARAGVYMEALGNLTVAKSYARQAGEDAYTQFTAMLDDATP